MDLTEKQIHDLNMMNEAARRSMLGDLLKGFQNIPPGSGVSLDQVKQITDPMQDEIDDLKNNTSSIETDITNIYKDIQDLQSETGNLDIPHYLFVNADSKETEENGGLTTPYKSIQAAINNAQFGTVIEIAPGEYNENIIISNKENLSITTAGVIGQYRVKIDGNLTITGAQTERIGISNIEFGGNYLCDTTLGLVYMDNVAIVGSSTFSGAGYHRYDFCFFSAILHNGSGFIDIRESQIENNAKVTVESTPTAIIALISVYNLNVIHTSGNLYVGGSTKFLSDSSGVGLLSTCTSTQGAIQFDGGTMLQATGVYATINKTGNCPYMLSTLVYEPNTSTFMGTKIDGGLHTEQIYDHVTRFGYTITGSGSVRDHLDGISNALLDLQKRITDIENNVTFIADDLGLTAELPSEHEDKE